jgi:PAS domain S-box-containing protein
MSITNEIKTIGIQRFVIFTSIYIIGGLFALFALTDGPYIFDLRFNIFAVLSFIGVATNLVVLLYLRKYDHKNEENFWFALMLVALVVFGLGEMFQRLSETPEGALFWGKVSAFGVGFESIAVFMFALSYIGVQQRKMLLAPIAITGAAFIMFFQTKTQLIFKDYAGGALPYLWGYNNDIGEGFILNALWVLLYSALAIILLIRFRRRSPSIILKKQSSIFIIAFSVPLIGAILTDILAPMFGLRVPPLHIFFATITSVLILYGMRRYHAFKVSPARLSDEILKTMNEAVLVINQDFGIEMMNAEAEKMFGKNADNMEGTPIGSYFDGEHSERIKQALEEIKTDTRITAVDNLVIKTSNLTGPLYVRASISRISEENGLTGYILVLADITELKRSYDLLEYEKNNVEHIVQERTTELREAQAKLIETDKLKTEFVILASHNLRTPVTILKGSIEMAESAKGIDDDHRKILQNAMTAATRLGGLVEDLLTISSIEAGDKLILNNVTLNDVVEPLVEEVKLQVAAKNIAFVSRLVGSKSIKINANLSRLQSAIRSVLDNAVKFTKKGTVTLSIKKDDDSVHIIISDEGIGINESEMPKLFDKFHRGSDALKYNYDGEGIGLYLAKLIIDEHSGKIDIKSKENEGTTVTITLPIIK